MTANESLPTHTLSHPPLAPLLCVWCRCPAALRISTRGGDVVAIQGTNLGKVQWLNGYTPNITAFYGPASDPRRYTGRNCIVSVPNTEVRLPAESWHDPQQQAAQWSQAPSSPPRRARPLRPIISGAPTRLVPVSMALSCVPPDCYLVRAGKVHGRTWGWRSPSVDSVCGQRPRECDPVVQRPQHLPRGDHLIRRPRCDSVDSGDSSKPSLGRHQWR
jgi:hypothetical protein